MVIFAFSSFPTSFYSCRIPIKRPCLFLLARLGKRIDIENGAKYYDIITGQNGLRSPAVFILPVSSFPFLSFAPRAGQNKNGIIRQLEKIWRP